MPTTPAGSRFALSVIAVLAMLLLSALGIFGWLVVNSLSERKLQEILLETEQEAVGLADRIAGQAEREGQDLFTAVATERETQTYIDAVLRKRDIVQSVEIRDRQGVVVLRTHRQATIERVLPPTVGSAETPGGLPDVVTRTFETPSTYDVRVPIGELGELNIGLSRGQLEDRVSVLRRELLRQVAALGGVTLAILLGAFLVIFLLWRRGQGLQEQAAEAERLAYVGTLASGLAHEIRNPLNSLSLNMQLLEEELGVGGRAPGGRLLEITRSEIGRLERLVSDFLTYARPRALERETVLAVEPLEHVSAVLAPELEATGARVQVVDRTAGARVRLDRAQIQQLLLNLMRNALHACEGTGRAPRITLAVSLESGQLVYEVTDNGAGIPREARERIFDVFYSTRKGGTGLGLAIVLRIARAHGGSVEVDGEPGHGTTFRVRLPRDGRGGGGTSIEAAAPPVIRRSDGPPVQDLPRALPDPPR